MFIRLSISPSLPLWIKYGHTLPTDPYTSFTIHNANAHSFSFETCSNYMPEQTTDQQNSHVQTSQNLHRSDWQLCHFLSLLWSSLHIVVPECSNMKVMTAASDFWVMSAFIPFLEKCQYVHFVCWNKHHPAVTCKLALHCLWLEEY